LARLMVTAVRVEGPTKAEVTRDYGVSPRVGLRPHRAIDRHTLSEAFVACPKAAPSLPGVPASSHVPKPGS